MNICSMAERLNFFYLFLAFNIQSFAQCSAESEATIYHLTSGSYKPVESKIFDVKLHKLINIPYGSVKSSFQQAEEYKPLVTNTTQFNTEYPKLCLQPLLFKNNLYGNFKLPHDYSMSLDCLKINLYVPANAQSRKNLTAMFFIHGGSNAAGSATFFDASALAALGDVIVAMPNYRLDFLGFLSMQSLNSTQNNSRKYSGNYGLWDQLLALKWLYNNCEALGCDRRSITVFGHSAGSSDAQLLGQSALAQPYMKRVILQSGSSLAHWSYVYESHVYEAMNKETSFDAKKLARLFGLLKLDKSKYVNTMNDTMISFLTYTTCNLTHKYECIVQKLSDFYTILNEKNTDEGYAIFGKIFDRFDLDEILIILGYLNRINIDYTNKIAYYLFITQNFSFETKNAEKNETNSKRFESLMQRKTFKSNDSNEREITREEMVASRCILDLMALITNSKNLRFLCDLFEENHESISNSLVLKFFSNCFRNYFEIAPSETAQSPPIDLNRMFFFKNTDLILDEMTSCFSYANSLGPHPDASDSLLLTGSLLTENSNYIHKTVRDGRLVPVHPHSNLAPLNNIDLLMGVTSHESFFFLFHEYNINDILMHSFIYSSLMNMTDNLITKLYHIQTDRQVNFCLKRELFKFYEIEISKQELESNVLKNISKSLQLISDYDFFLPLFTHLKYLKTAPNESTLNKKNAYVYLYAHSNSFNYLLEHMKTFNMNYKHHLDYFQNDVSPHFSELDYVFGLPVLSKLDMIKEKNLSSVYLYNYTQIEYDLSLRIMKYWTNFAKFGNPNGENATEGEWKKFDAKNPKIFQIRAEQQAENLTFINELLKRHEFWYDRLPNQVFNSCMSESQANSPAANKTIFGEDVEQIEQISTIYSSSSSSLKVLQMNNVSISSTGAKFSHKIYLFYLIFFSIGFIIWL